MIKIKLLHENWKNNEFTKESIEQESERLYNALWAFHENGLIGFDNLKIELRKLEKAQEKFK